MWVKALRWARRADNLRTASVLIFFLVGVSSPAMAQVGTIDSFPAPALVPPAVAAWRNPGTAAPGPELAQIGVIGGPSASGLSAPPVATGRPEEFAAPGRERTALALDDWLIYPTAFGGFFYDSNPAQSPVATSSFGTRLVPSFLAERADGIHKTSLYGMADARFFFTTIDNTNNLIAARAGVTEIYQPLSDLVLTGQLDFTRQRDLFATFGVDPTLTPLNPTGVGLAPSTNPVSYNQLVANATVQKTFSEAFVLGSANVLDLSYDRPSLGQTAPSPDGTIYTGSIRGGYWIVPVLYGFGEVLGDTRRYATNTLSSSGYRITGGVGSDQVGLFKGEASFGYQSEMGDSPALGTISGIAFNGQIHYFPLPELTIDTSFGRTIGVSLLANASNSSVGTSTVVTNIIGQARYQLAQEWSASGRAGFIHTDYTGNVRKDDSWTAGTTVTYSVWQNLGVTLDFQYIELSSNIPFQSFSREVVTLGLTYKY